MSVRDTEERLEEVDNHFIGINDKFIESNDAVTRLQTGLNNSYKQIRIVSNINVPTSRFKLCRSKTFKVGQRAKWQLSFDLNRRLHIVNVTLKSQ